MPNLFAQRAGLTVLGPSGGWIELVLPIWHLGRYHPAVQCWGGGGEREEGQQAGSSVALQGKGA